MFPVYHKMSTRYADVFLGLVQLVVLSNAIWRSIAFSELSQALNSILIVFSGFLINAGTFVQFASMLRSVRHQCSYDPDPHNDELDQAYPKFALSKVFVKFQLHGILALMLCQLYVIVFDMWGQINLGLISTFVTTIVSLLAMTLVYVCQNCINK